MSGRPVMLVGGAGTGKTTILQDLLSNLDSNWMQYDIAMNFYTDSFSLQQQLENPIDKRSGHTFGPPSGRKLVYFVDDLNLPYVETYGTQNSLSLMRQLIDHGNFFDRIDLGFRTLFYATPSKTIQQLNNIFLVVLLVLVNPPKFDHVN